VKPRLAEFDAYLREVDGSLVNLSAAAESAAAEHEEALVLAGGAR
jgi:hypothetical protein